MSRGGRLRSRDSRATNRLKEREQVAPPEDFESRPPIFSFEYLQNGWCINDCVQLERSKMLERLRLLSSLSWKQIRQEDRHRYGTEVIERSSFKAPIPSFITPDVKLIAFRAYDLVAMVGYKKDRTFNVVWIDREFKLYNH